jgi:AcrR family transcriptional regulator
LRRGGTGFPGHRHDLVHDLQVLLEGATGEPRIVGPGGHDDGGAARAGVGKASIYRRWPSKGALAFDATLDEYLAGQPTRDTGGFEGDLLATARDWIQSVKCSPSGRTLRFLTAEVQSDPSLADAWQERFVRQVRQQRRPIVERAIGRGEIPAASDPELILDMLYGPLYHRFLHGHLPLDDAFAIGVAGMTAAAAGAAVRQAHPPQQNKAQ